jgi:hypothetical protein
MRHIAAQPFGRDLLILTAIGLGGYAIWRLTQALVGHTPEYGQHSAFDRIGAAGSAQFTPLGDSNIWRAGIVYRFLFPAWKGKS